MKASKSDKQLEGCYDPSDGLRHPHKWGYADTKFDFDGNGGICVTGDRYSLSGYKMPGFLAFAEKAFGVTLRPEDRIEELKTHAVPEPKLNTEFVTAIRDRFCPDRMSTKAESRLVHSHGQRGVGEIYHLLYVGSLDRTVDAVVYPHSEEEIRAFVRLANEHDVCLVPYGGGTNVSGALTCPTEERRMIVSVDMGRMNRILWLDEENGLACAEAGITGKKLERELASMGYTCGHDPDSVELSTLGGWISTNASGMKRNRYGNIEDIVLEATLITPTGDIETHAATPRSSTGVQPRVFLFGSEGNFGIITKGIIKVHPLPEVRRYGSVVFPNFEAGVDFLKELHQSGQMPASIRLVYNYEFRFGQALKPNPGRWQGLIQKLQKFLMFRILGFEPTKLAACTIVMEGTRREVRQQKKLILKAARGHGGARNGKRGYMLTFAITYIRDFFNQFQILGETFGTSVPWSRIHTLTHAVAEELAHQTRLNGIGGNPYLSYRVTQTYHTGVCVYFTMGFSVKGLKNPERVFNEIEERLRQVILDNGGSLSHHHGIGKVRQTFLPQIQSENSMHVLRESKRAIDPNNVFGIRNGVFVE